MNPRATAKVGRGADASRHPDFPRTFPSRPSAVREDYLVAILDGSRGAGTMRGTELALALAVTHPTVTIMLTRLRAAGWITHHHHRDIALTPAGRALAEDTVRRRQAVEAWLRGLGLNETTVRRDAHVIEHGISQATCLALENWLLRGRASSVSPLAEPAVA